MNEITWRAHAVANAEIAECLRDLNFALCMPEHEGRVQKIAGCIEGIERAVKRLRLNVLSQKEVVYIPADEALLAATQSHADGMRRAAEIAVEAWKEGIPPAEIGNVILEEIGK